MNIRSLTIPVAICFLAASPAVAQEPAAKPPVMKTVQEKASYAIGLQIGTRLRADGAEVDTAILARGIADAIAENKPLLTEQEIATVMEAYSKEMQARSLEKSKVLSAKNKKEGEAFLAANKTKKGVKTLPSGLQYEVLKAGDGATPKASDTIRAHYHGTLVDGTVFDSSVQREEPIVIGVGNLIQGWQEALQMMKVGSKWRIVVPADLAYGDAPSGPGGPDSVLVFELDLLGIEE